MGDRLPDGYCLWEMDDVGFTVGLIGTGPGFRAILDIVCGQTAAEFLPPMTLVGLSEPGTETEKMRDRRVAGLPVYNTWREMMAAHPDINLLIELAGKRHKVKQIMAELPDGVAFIDHTATFFLCALEKFAEVNARCQASLDSQRVLLQAIVNEVPEDILLLDRQGRVVDANRNVEARLGQPKESFLGKPCYEVQAVRDDMPFCEPDKRSCPFYTALSTGQKAESLETRVSKDGRMLYFREYAYPIYDASRSIGHVMVMRRDITSRTEYEKRLQQSEKIGVVERLSAYLAHEIRNPLFAIGGFTNSLLKSPNISEREREKVKIILEETARLDAILKDIIGFARPGADVPGEVDVCAVVREALGVLRQGFIPKGVALESEDHCRVPRAVAHEDVLRRAVMHLVANAVESIEGEGRVVVRVGMDAGFVRIAVSDTGKGMPQGVLEHVFSPFFGTKHKGYGLGLAMIRKAVEDWGGQVEIASREGHGTDVVLRLTPVPALVQDAPEKG
ncbi:two-component system sensor histidine kinase NtrB [Fundidesulfovibrio soli]|uniref:two-component system sensor histidine kinase NtrB n=1 Tax=Fundidesulfovibrio soli TaxID=2922716 RepID=UPI001FB04935|nr:ATP-binding protein [Fundidesulfovibrio soli]